jgi:phosphatidylcholine synthase
VITAWLAHLFTASGVLLAFLATLAVVEREYRMAFFWLGLQIAIDCVDGVVARAARVSEKLPWFDGAKLDDIIDYLTYVFVPALIVWRAALVPDGWTLPVAGAVLLSSAYGFNRGDAKTADHFFTGFPSYWNIVVFYQVVGGWPKGVNAAILLGLAVLVFVPIRYLYPSRTPLLRWPTILLGVIWGVAMVVMLWQFPLVSRPLFWFSLLFPLYYFGVSLWLEVQRRAARS